MRAKTQYTSRLRVTTSTSIHGNALRILHGLGSFGPKIPLLSTEEQSSTHLCTWPTATKDAADSNHSNCHGNACNLKHDTTALTPSKIKIDTPPSGRKSCLDSCKDMAVHAMLPPPEEKERRGLLLKRPTRAHHGHLSVTCRWLIKIIIDNSQDMKKKRYNLLCPEIVIFCTSQVYLHQKPYQKSSSSRSRAVSPPRKSKKRRNCAILRFCQLWSQCCGTWSSEVLSDE